MNKITIIIICSFVIILLIIGCVFLIIRGKKKNKLLKTIDKLTFDKNTVVPANLITEIAKAEKLANNKSLVKCVNDWKTLYDKITIDELGDITDKIVELENRFADKDYNNCDELISDIESNIFETKGKATNLLNDVKDLTESKERNREAIVKLKSIYREIVFKYNKNKGDYKDLNDRIDLQFENIDKLFSGFEVAIDNNEYDEISKIVKALDDLINNISLVIEEAPTALLLAEVLIPKKINDIKLISDKMISNGYNLDYLNIDENIMTTNKTISEILDRLKVLNMENSIFDLKTISDYYENIYNDFENEKSSKKNYERYLLNIKERISKVNSDILMINGEIDNIKETFDLKSSESDIINEINSEFNSIKDEFKKYSDRSLVRTSAYSKIVNNFERIMINLSKTEERLESAIKSLSGLKEDEARARDQVSEIKNIILESKKKIRSYNLPIIPKTFETQLNEANEAVKDIISELSKKPISVKTLNIRVETSRDLALKLYQTSCDIIKIVNLSEMVIVYGNRYRSTYNEINDSLNESTKLFYEGEYKKSLEKSLNSLNTIEPGIFKRILKGDE